MSRKSLTALGGALVATVVLLTALPSLAAMVHRVDFTGTVDEVIGGKLVRSGGATGWTSTVRSDDEKTTSPDVVRIGGAALSFEEGAMRFVLERSSDKVGNDFESVVSLVDDEGVALHVFTVVWEKKRGAETRIEFAGSIENPLRDKLWDYHVPVGRTVKRGERIDVLITWGQRRDDNRIYVDGRELEMSYNKWARRYMGKPGGPPKTFADYYAGNVTDIVVGTYPYVNPDGGLVYEPPLNDSVIWELEFYDRAITPREAGGEVMPTGLAVASLEHDALRQAGFSGALVAGDDVTVTLEGTQGAAASFDVARLADIRGEIPLSWRGYGVYLEEKVFFDDDEIDLGDVEEYRVYVSTSPIGVITEDTPFVEALEVEEQSYVADGLDTDVPYYVAVMALMDDGSLEPVIGQRKDLAMTEVDGSPGIYEGTLTVGYGDVYREAVVVGRLSAGEAKVSITGGETFAIDPSLNIAVNASPEELKADEKSESKVRVTVTDANGEPVSDREIRFILASTSQYTGVVGGGQFAEEVGGSLGREFTATTDLFGQVEVTYTAGFAAKTAIIVARDMESNSTGAGYVKTYITATAELELEAVQEVAGKALGYSITVTSSDEWLTADGESEARITALVTKDGIPVEGHRIGFSVSSGSGKIRAVQGVTDSGGRARAVYTAGKRIGVVLIRAVDHTVGITGAVQIELRSDAPAKIAITLTPDLLPADGRSTADVEVLVTDINDNPNEGVEVEYAVAIGSGMLRRIDDVTDDDGVSTAEYVAGRIPGKVSIGVTVRSTVPTDEELTAARALATAVSDSDFF